MPSEPTSSPETTAKPARVTARPNRPTRVRRSVVSYLAAAWAASWGLAIWEASRLESTSWGMALVAVAGLLGPAALLLGAAAWSVAGLLESRADGASGQNEPATPSGPSEMGSWPLLGAVLALLWLPVVSSVALAQFNSADSALAAALAAAWPAVLLAIAGFVFAVVGAERIRLLESFQVTGRLVWSIAIGFSVLGGVALIGLGETSGAGGVLTILGVLRREELDLALPIEGIFTIGAALLAARWFPPVFAWAVLGIVPVVLFASQLVLNSGALAFELERRAPLAAVCLSVGQRMTDGDGDGFSDLFGGGDCNDHNGQVFPGAIEIRGNGVDEDCSGADAGVVVEQAAAPPATAQVIQAETRRPLNVLLLTIDTLRADLGYTGYARPISPHLDELAKRAVVYERAYSLASYTGKSLPPMLIGKYPSETHRGFMHFNRYPEQDVMVQERLAKSGFKTLSIQGHWYFDVKTGLGRGFDVLDLSASPKVAQGEGDRTVNSDKISDAAIAALRTLAPDERYFMWVHYLDPHAEYVRHEEFDFGSDARALYDGEVAFTDAQIGRVLATLKETGLAETTAVIVTSDHGEAFREHGMIRHGFELWEELVRVPLLIAVPGVPPRRIAARRSAIDIAPTLLDLALGEPMRDADLSGQSLVGELTAEGEPAERPIFLDMPAGPYNSDRQSFITDDYKITTSSLRPMGVYNLATDPGETQNLMKDAELSTRLLDELKQFRSGLQLVFVKPR